MSTSKPIGIKTMATTKKSPRGTAKKGAVKNSEQDVADKQEQEDIKNSEEGKKNK